VQELKAELAMVGMWAGLSAGHHEPLNADQRAQLQQQVGCIRRLLAAGTPVCNDPTGN
jgi:hypothetical protein